ncbi:unnamed protein product [Rotaria sordida]|uniref:glucose-6-phosphate dehydrogenase (NADP(+)) n=1 Tax=Rotaria sordida TaxID=392033 RepID=A0A815VNF5_9BILA|nr:unnamed protein product [Rotaria sordida]CAF1534340.1 unnamed protein product [Rotaria sordida]
MQILSIVALEKSCSTKGEDIRDEKVKVLRCISPIKMEDVVLGQYIDKSDSSDNEYRQGYLDNPGVSKDSKTPTYNTQVVLLINNEQDTSIDFSLSKALNEKKIKMRIQFRDGPGKTELNLTYGEKYKGVKLSNAYEHLILDVFMDSKINFVRSDELQEA